MKMKALAFSSILVLAFLSGSFSLGSESVILVDPIDRYPVSTIQTNETTNAQQEQILITPSPNLSSLDFNDAHQKICQRSTKKRTQTNATKPTNKPRRRWLFW